MNNQGKKLFLASPRGFCSGVKKAIELAEETIEKNKIPIYIFNELVHNKNIVKNFENKGVIFVNKISDIPNNSIIIFSAHGVSKKIEKLAKEKQLKVVDATCPLVLNEHKKVVDLDKKGYAIIIIGNSQHPEIIGTLGQVKNEHFVISKKSDIEKLPKFKNKKIAFLMQTTLDIDEIQGLLKDLYLKFPHIEGDSDVCYATKNRQKAIAQLAKDSEVIFVVGSKNSSNSNKLRDRAENLGCPAFLIDNVDEITEDMFKKYSKIGITAGASAPEYIVQNVIKYFENFQYNL